MVRPVLVFPFACALLGEGLELLRLGPGGSGAVGWSARALLFAFYGGTGLLALGVARALRRGIGLAAFLFLAVLVVPWLNADYLPAVASPASVAGTLAALAACAVLAAAAARFPVAAAALAVLVGLAGNWQARIVSPRGRTTPALGVRPAYNIMIVVLDTLRADHLGAYGYHRRTSPAFDRLAAEGLLFEHANSQAGWTKPSVATLLTGVYPHRHGVMSEVHALGTKLPVLGEWLGRAGYRTVAFSSNPWVSPQFRFDRGFEEFHQSVRTSGIQLTLLFRIASRMEVLLRRAGLANELSGRLRALVEAYPTNTERDLRLLAELRSWLRAHRGERFFAYVHLIGPHAPYDPPEEFAARFRPAAWRGGRPPVDPPTRARSVFEPATPVDDLTREMFIAQYDGAIAFTDSLLGRIRSELEDLGVLDETLLVVTSDHGEEFYEHGSWRHWHALYNEVIHVPLLLRLPGVVPVGRRVDRVMLADIAPTLAEVAGLTPPVAFDGRSLLAAPLRERTTFAEYWEFHGAGYESRAALRDHWKIIHTRDGRRQRERTEFYDLAGDPGERVDLVATGRAGFTPALAALRAELARFAGARGHEAPRVVLDEETRRRMGQLGY